MLLSFLPKHNFSPATTGRNFRPVVNLSHFVFQKNNIERRCTEEVYHRKKTLEKRKNYSTPQVSMIELIAEDILTVSVITDPGYDPDMEGNW